MNLNLAQQPRTHKHTHQNSRAAAATLATLLVCAQLSCGGGSSNSGGGGTPQRTFTTIDAPGAGTVSGTLQGTYAVDLNASGDAAGYYVDSNGEDHGFIYSASGAITTVDVPEAGNLGTGILGIDTAGDTTGFYVDSQDIQHSFFRSAGGAITTFDPPNTIGSGAQSLNDSGTVAGGFIDANGAHGYLRTQDGTFTIFDPTGTPAQIQIVIPYQINASGAVAGTYIDTGGVYHGFYRDPSGNITVLNAPGAGTAATEGTEVIGINASGTIIGGIAIGNVNGVFGASHSFILTTDGTYNVFDPPQATAHSSICRGLNDSGTVAGIYRDSNLVRHGYLLTPSGAFTSFDDPQAPQVPVTDETPGTETERINASGGIVGWYADSSGVRHGFLWQ